MEEKIGSCICRYRQLRNMTQGEFASRLGVTPQAVSKWERGIGLPDLSLVPGICAVLDIGADTLLGCEKAVVENGDDKASSNIMDSLLAEPLVLEFGSALIPMVVEGLKTDFVNEKRNDLALRKGYLMPIIRLRDNVTLGDEEFRVLIYGTVFHNEKLTVEPQYYFMEMLSVVTRLCEQNYATVLNKQIVKALVDNVRARYPAVVEGVVPEQISYMKIYRVLQEKARKQEDFRDMIHILEAIEEEALPSNRSPFGI